MTTTQKDTLEQVLSSVPLLRDAKTAIELISLLTSIESQMNLLHIHAVLTARENGATWAAIGKASGMSKQGAHKVYSELTRDMF